MLWVVLLGLPLAALGAVSPSQVLSTTSARSSGSHPLVASSGALTLWCSADSPIKKAFFTKTGDATRREAKVQGSNASLTIEHPTVLDAGDYACELDTQRGRRNERTTVFVRPVVHTDHPEKLEARDSDEFRLDAPALSVVQGEEVLITCPVFAHPMPNVKWSKDGKPLTLSPSVSVDGARLRISAAEYSHEGVYQCDAINEYTVASKTHRPLTVVSRALWVKSQYSWVIPLVVIVAILAVLAVTIVLCEFRRRKKDKLISQYGED